MKNETFRGIFHLKGRTDSMAPFTSTEAQFLWHQEPGSQGTQVEKAAQAGLGLISFPSSSLHLPGRSNKPAWGITRQIGNMENLWLNLCNDITFLCCNGENWTYWIAHHTDMEFWKPLLLHKCWQDILFTASLKVKEAHSPEDSFFQLLISIKANFGSNQWLT